MDNYSETPQLQHPSTELTESGILPSAHQVSLSFDAPPKGISYQDAHDADMTHMPSVSPSGSTANDQLFAPEGTAAAPNSALPEVAQVLDSSKPSIDSKCTLPLKGMRCFLDICCGVNSPLASAVRNLQGDVMRFDLLVHSSGDLLNATCFETLLRVCASGMIALAGASPSCCEYSRLKLLPHGPPALRTPTHLDGSQV